MYLDRVVKLIESPCNELIDCHLRVTTVVHHLSIVGTTAVINIISLVCYNNTLPSSLVFSISVIIIGSYCIVLNIRNKKNSTFSVWK